MLGFCGAVFGWPTSFITATAIVNSVAQLSLFSIPIFKAIETSKGFGQTSSYIKILVKCASFLAVAVVFYLVSAAMGEQHNTWGAVTFREIAQLAHTVRAYCLRPRGLQLNYSRSHSWELARFNSMIIDVRSPRNQVTPATPARRLGALATLSDQHELCRALSG